jgi:hypothetical protein
MLKKIYILSIRRQFFQISTEQKKAAATSTKGSGCFLYHHKSMHNKLGDGATEFITIPRRADLGYNRASDGQSCF